MKLNKYDYKILEFLQSTENCSLEEILKKFPDSKYGTKYRLLLLTSDKTEVISLKENLFYPSELKKADSESYIIAYNNPNEFKISSKGAKALQDYKLSRRITFLKCLDSLIFRILPLLISLLAIYETKN